MTLPAVEANGLGGGLGDGLGGGLGDGLGDWFAKPTTDATTTIKAKTAPEPIHSTTRLLPEPDGGGGGELEPGEGGSDLGGGGAGLGPGGGGGGELEPRRFKASSLVAPITSRSISEI
jgi:hypothetical protein